MEDSSTLREPRRATVLFIFFTVLLDMLALGLIIPVLPKLVVMFLGGDTARGAEMYGLFGTIWALMNFLFAPFLGALSDRFGRRRVILLSCFGLGLDYLFMANAPTLWWLLAGRAISGMTSASVPTAYAYIADTTSAENRAKSFGLMGAAFGIGFVLGPAFGGLLGAVDPRLPFWAAAVLSLSNALYGLFVLPESLPPDKRAPFEWKRANPLGALNLLRSNPRLPGLATVYFLSNLSHVVLPSTFVLYTSYRYGWDARTIGLTLAGVGICSGAVQGGLVGPIIARLGETRTLMLGLFCGMIGYALAGLAPTGGWLWISIPFSAFWGLATPSLQGLMTRQVGAAEQGRLQGANGSLNGIAQFIGPSIFTHLFAFGIAKPNALHQPGLPFFLAALLIVGAMGATRLVIRRIPAEPSAHPTSWGDQPIHHG